MLIGTAVGSLGATLYYKNKLQGKKLLIHSLDTGALIAITLEIATLIKEIFSKQKK